ncbi:MAG: acyl-CoA synthetase [Gammaproteobacteria bacterium]|nr:MAG: acyl-CoA synthetase [Gammaproteobacteria bacterium]
MPHSGKLGARKVEWNIGNIYDAVVEVCTEDDPALIHSGPGGSKGLVISWPEFDRRTNRLARFLQEAGLQPDSKVAHYMRNCPAYVESLVASFKGRFVHVNINYRYLDDELHYIMENSDSEAVVFASEFRPQVEALKDRLPLVKAWIEVPPYFSDEPWSSAPFATNFNEAIAQGDSGKLDIERLGSDLMFIYTGGTTGMPKAVMWENETFWEALGSGSSLLAEGVAPPVTIAEHTARVTAAPMRGRLLAACPLMHGTALLGAISTLSQGGCVVTMPEMSLDTEAMWRTVERYGVNSMAIVGDAFAKPMLRELDNNPDEYDISSVMGMLSSGVMWSPEVKQGLLKHNQNMVLADLFGASEGVGFGSSITTSEESSQVAKFQIGEECKVFTEDFREVVPGSGEPGFTARSGGIPLGYYKDEKKTASTFPVINGVRYSVPGDWCTVDTDGTLTLLGRGSVCINSGGEKIYPEEIEEALKAHESVDDALVVGIPDERWGQAVTGVVVLATDSQLDEEALRNHVKKHLAAYKAPKRVLSAGVALRAPNGKADYKGVTDFAVKALG